MPVMLQGGHHGCIPPYQWHLHMNPPLVCLWGRCQETILDLPPLHMLDANGRYLNRPQGQVQRDLPDGGAALILAVRLGSFADTGGWRALFPSHCSALSFLLSFATGDLGHER